LRDGPWAKWFAGKRFRELGLFRQGQKHGLYVTWYGSGKRKDAIHYENDLEHGPVASWYSSGKKRKEGHHKHGEKDGVWITYNYNTKGIEAIRQRYENGNPLD
jgi:antitoxin component YwqK of YwqJK toxin-antitoxin module